MQMFAHRATEAGIRRIQYGKEMARLEREREERRAQIVVQIEELNKELERTVEPVVIKSEFKRIEERACRVFDVTPVALKSTRRHRKLAMARQFVMYWAMRRTLLSSTQIGRLLGGRDHTTALAGRDAYREKRGKMGRFLKDSR